MGKHRYEPCAAPSPAAIPTVCAAPHKALVGGFTPHTMERLLNWYVYAITAAIFYAAQMLGLRRLQKTYPIPVYMAYVWLSAGVLIGLMFIRSTDQIAPGNMLLILGAAVGSWAGMYGVNKAFRMQPNIGYVDAVGTLRLGLIYGLSVLLFGAFFEPIKLLLVGGTILGVVLIVGLEGHPPHETSAGRPHCASESRLWVVWVLFSVLCFTMLFVCIRLATAQGMDARVATSLVMLIAGGMYVASALRNGMSLSLSRDWHMVALTSVFSTIGNIAFFSSLTMAPNLAYTDAIVNLRVVILYSVALLIGADRLRPVKALGVALTFGCAVLLG
jgi:drug/metabolite transporter (DMT)-like permease